MVWAKGQSGNPAGRRRTKPLEDALRIELLANPDMARRIARALLEMAATGNTKAAGLVFDRIDGPVIKTIEAQMQLDAQLTVDDVSREERIARVRALMRQTAQDLVVIEDKR